MGAKKLLATLLLGLISICSNLMSKHCLDTDKYINYDYIIVGNGTAGAVLARKLSDDGCKKVLVLEHGINRDNDPNVLKVNFTDINEALPILNLLTIDPKYAINYVMQAPSGPLQYISYSEGVGWSGSGIHNYLAAVRGTPSIYDSWATLSGNELWSYNNMLPLMLAFENYTPFDSATLNPTQRGVGGPISITQLDDITSDPLAILFASFTNAGFITDYNDPTETSTTGKQNVGFSSFQAWATPGAIPGSIVERSFSSRSFLTPSVVTPEGKGVGRLLRIESNALVSRVIIENNKAIGVEFVYGETADKALKAYGEKIILCAGSINSPAILQRSGIGDPSILIPLGIDVVVNNPNVGANLVDHVGASFVALVPTEYVTTAALALTGFYSGYSSSLAAPFVYPDDSTRRIQTFVFGLDPVNGIILANNFVLNPNSRGSVQIVSSNPLIYPKVDLGFYTDDPSGVGTNGTDINLMATAFYIQYNAIKSVGGVALAPTEFDFANPNFLSDAIKTPCRVVVPSHAVGTTRMATSIATGVVDGNLNVFGVENLMVADIGVIPQMPNGNTGYHAFMVALRAATILGVPVPPAL